MVKGLCNRIFFFIKVAYLRNFSNVEAEVFCKVEPHKLRHSDVEMAYNNRLDELKNTYAKIITEGTAG